ncbi:MAG: hypothetical protein ACFHX7_04240 [Pseudomonadota bacterium]
MTLTFSNKYRWLLLASLMATAGNAVAASTDRLDNFVLLDQHGKANEMYYNRDADAVVIVAQANSCPGGQETVAALQALAAAMAGGDVRTFMINATDSRAKLAERAASWGADVPILHDSARIITPSLGLGFAGEALVVDPSNWSIVYRGPVTDPTFAAAVGALAGDNVFPPRTVAATGCALGIDPPAQVASYADDIVPLLQQNCMACHVEGGIGPWAMSEYNMILGFAPMMREVVRVKRMPPWHADPAIGEWQHSAAMSDEDTRTLINWIEAGAPRGEGEDPLLAAKVEAPLWPLGEPDLILEVPEFEIPATGIVDYQFPVVANPLDHDVWVRAATVIPGNTQVVHHVLMGSADQAPADKDRESVFENYIMGYAPGNESAFMPEGTGVFVPVGGVYLFQMHYTPTGKATTDSTRVGLYFADEPPANFLRQQVVLNPRIRIPANTEAHEEAAYFEFWDDATIYSLVPHAHYRGKSSTFELVYPDGATEVILSVPNYDFNWQRTYSFTEPKTVPKGTKIVHRTVYDNSAKNPANPDPNREVPWGLQSFDEMLYGSVSFAWNNERSDAPMHSQRRADTSQFIGFLDTNMDGKLSKDELPRRMRESLGWWKWWFVDKNFDGGLDLAEMEAMFSRGGD